LLSTKINYLYIKGHHLAVFHEVGVQIKESWGIIFRKCTEVEDAIEEEMTKQNPFLCTDLPSNARRIAISPKYVHF
jgi:hypothetical protein